MYHELTPDKVRVHSRTNEMAKHKENLRTAAKQKLAEHRNEFEAQLATTSSRLFKTVDLETLDIKLNGNALKKKLKSWRAKLKNENPNICFYNTLEDGESEELSESHNSQTLSHPASSCTLCTVEQIPPPRVSWGGRCRSKRGGRRGAYPPRSG